MSVTAATIRSTHMNSPQGKQSLSSPGIDYVASKKRKEDNAYSPTHSRKSNIDSNDVNMLSSVVTTNSNNNNTKNEMSVNKGMDGAINGGSNTSSPSAVPTLNGSDNSSSSMYSNNSSQLNGGHMNQQNGQYPGPTMNGNGDSASSLNSQQNSTLDPAAPLPNEIFELLNDFWRPNELVTPDAHLINGKFSRRSPDCSLEDPVEEEKDGDDDITSLADNEINNDRGVTQKRRYSRLSDGYERLKGVLPTVKDKRRVSKARILDEAINYIQRLESITSVLKREHEKRLSMLNGSNGFFPDYSVQPYMRSLFQKQMYTSGNMSGTKMSSYGKNSGSQSSLPKSPRMKQQSYNSAHSYNSQQNTMAAGGVNGSSMAPSATDYNFNNIGNAYSTSSLYQSTAGEQMMNGDTASPISNTSPYSACSLSPGSTPTTYQNGSAVNNTWPYQGVAMPGYESSSGQMTSYNRQGSSGSTGGYTTNSNPYSAINGGMWGNMSSDTSSQVAHQAASDHSMKVG